MRVHFGTTTTTTPTVPVSRSIQQVSHILQKAFKILNTADSYMVTRETHGLFNMKLVAIDSGASANYYHNNYEEEIDNPLAPKGNNGLC